MRATVRLRRIREVVGTYPLCVQPFLAFCCRTQLDAAGTALKITPHAGTIGPESSVFIKVQLSPTEEKSISASIPCKINQKSRPLILDIKGEGYRLMPSLKLVDRGEPQAVHR